LVEPVEVTLEWKVTADFVGTLRSAAVAGVGSTLGSEAGAVGRGMKSGGTGRAEDGVGFDGGAVVLEKMLASWMSFAWLLPLVVGEMGDAGDG
jgi:hypothetical protein